MAWARWLRFLVRVARRAIPLLAAPMLVAGARAQDLEPRGAARCSQTQATMPIECRSASIPRNHPTVRFEFSMVMDATCNFSTSDPPGSAPEIR